MRGNIAEKFESQQPTAATEIRHIESGDVLELKKLSDFAVIFLNATEGDPAEAERLMDDFIDLLFEGGALSTSRYRILLGQIRERL